MSKSVPLQLSNTQKVNEYEYIGHVRNFLKNGYGILFKDNIQIEANWNIDKINGFIKVKLNNSLVMIGRMKNYSIKENHAIDYRYFFFWGVCVNFLPRKIIENCYGIPRNYNEENGKLEIVSNMDKGNPEKRFTL